MTRSVEIPDEALAEAMDAYYSEGQYGREASEESMRAALAAALPYLAPTPSEAFAREQAGRAARGKDHEAGPWCQRFNCTSHPAAPAIPQPVDREALAKAIHDAACGCDHYGHMVEIDDHEAADIALAAVLAGGQEQD